MKKINTIDLSRTEWENLIDEWIFNERDRAILKRRLLDGLTFEQLASEFNYSTMLCLTNSIKCDKIKLPLMNIARVFISFSPCQINHSLQGGFFVIKKYLKIFKKTIYNLKMPCYNKGTK